MLTNNTKTGNREIKTGEVYWVDFDWVSIDHMQKGTRPAVIIQNNIGNTYSPNTIVFPMTTVMKKRSQPTHVFLPAKETGMLEDSMVLCENPLTVPKDKIYGLITTLNSEYQEQIGAALRVSMSI